MGAGMARQLVEHGHEVRVWNRSRDRAEPLAEAGATVADDPAEAVRGAAVAVVVLFDADSVIDVLEQAAPGLTQQTVVVQCSTVGLEHRAGGRGCGAARGPAAGRPGARHQAAGRAGQARGPRLR